MAGARVPPQLAAVVDARLDLKRWRNEWEARLSGAPTYWPYEILPAMKAFPQEVGKAFDNRMRKLAELDPLPASVPDPPPWDPRDPYAAFELGHYDGAFPKWEASMERDVAALTDMAVATLFPAFAAVPAARRHGNLWRVGDIEAPYGHQEPDLVLGDCLIELKAHRDATGPKQSLAAARQLAHLALQDRYDDLEIRHVAVYLARQGVVVDVPVNELFTGIPDLASLAALREEYRVARAAIEWKTYLSACQGEEVLAVYAFSVTSSVGGASWLELDWLMECPERDGLPQAARVIEMALRDHPVEDVVDALRGWRRERARRRRPPGPGRVLVNPKLYWGNHDALGIVLGPRLGELVQLARQGPRTRRRPTPFTQSPFRRARGARGPYLH